MDELLTSLLDDILFERALEQSLETHQSKLFEKTDNLELELESSIYDKKDNTNCFICYFDITNGDEIYKLECNHEYHKECLLKAVEHQHRLCPVCRKLLPIKEIKIEKENNNKKEHLITYHET
jgi:hypothetical protein